MRTIISTLAAIALLTPIAAEDKPADAPKAEGKGKGALFGVIKTADKDGDKALSAEEIGAIEDAEAKAKVLKLDTDQNGAVSGEEIEAYKKSMGEKKKEGEGEKKKKEGEGEAKAE